MPTLPLVASAHAAAPHHSVGKRYRFLSTHDVVTRLADRGFTVAHSSESRVRNLDFQGWQRHQVSLDFPEQDGLHLNGQKLQLRIVNSHCGRGAFRLYLAVYVLVCSNGLVAGRERHELLRLRHIRTGFDAEFVHDKALASASSTIRQIQRMQQRELSLDDQLHFAHYAIGLRWPDKTDFPFDPHLMLNARFSSQNQPDAWSVLNRVQDNALNGFAYYDHQQQHWRHVRKITSIPRDVALNQALWKYADALTA